MRWAIHSMSVLNWNSSFSIQMITVCRRQKPMKKAVILILVLLTLVKMQDVIWYWPLRIWDLKSRHPIMKLHRHSMRLTLSIQMLFIQRTILKPSSWLSNPLRNAMVFMRPLCRSLFTVCLVPACISTCHWMTRTATIFLVIRMMRMVSAKKPIISWPVC